MTANNTLAEWLQSTHGKYLLDREQALFDQGVADIFGFNAMQLGLPEHDLLRASRIPLRVVAGSDAGVQVRACADELPFDTGCMDLVLLPHVLEFSEHPHQILREVERIMMEQRNQCHHKQIPFSPPCTSMPLSGISPITRLIKPNFNRDTSSRIHYVPCHWRLSWRS